MRLLLDTHTVLRFFMGNSRLSDKVRDLVEDGHNHKLISMATVWEMSIKQNLSLWDEVKSEYYPLPGVP
ncbi:type II toxin-antitoxin system VapC family toxin [Arthrospira platensis BEA 1257B]